MEKTQRKTRLGLKMSDEQKAHMLQSRRETRIKKEVLIQTLSDNISLLSTAAFWSAVPAKVRAKAVDGLSKFQIANSTKDIDILQKLIDEAKQS